MQITVVGNKVQSIKGRRGSAEWRLREGSISSPDLPIVLPSGKSDPIPRFPVDSRAVSHKSLAVPTSQSGLSQWRRYREPH